MISKEIHGQSVECHETNRSATKNRRESTAVSMPLPSETESTWGKAPSAPNDCGDTIVEVQRLRKRETAGAGDGESMCVCGIPEHAALIKLERQTRCCCC